MAYRDQNSRKSKFATEPQREFPHERFQLGILPGQTCFALALLMNLKGFRGMGQEFDRAIGSIGPD